MVSASDQKSQLNSRNVSIKLLIKQNLLSIQSSNSLNFIANILIFENFIKELWQVFSKLIEIALVLRFTCIQHVVVHPSN